MLARVCLGLTLLLPAFQAAIAVDLWAVTNGVPVEGQTIPDEQFKYLDANTACAAEVPLPPPEPGCGFLNPTNMRNDGGLPQVQSVCIFDATNACGTPYTSIYGTNKYTWKRAKTCPAG